MKNFIVLSPFLFPFYLVSIFAEETSILVKTSQSATESINLKANKNQTPESQNSYTTTQETNLLKPQGNIRLKDAISMALKKNFNISIERLAVKTEAENPLIAESENFDPTFSLNSTYNTKGSPYYKRSSVYYTSPTSSQNWENEITISKKFSYGTNVSLYGNFERQFNLQSTPSPNSSTNVGVSISQPLLKNFGDTVNLAPIVQAHYSLSQAQLSLRKTTLDLIYDTQVAYWNLSASYALYRARLSSLNYAKTLLEETKKLRKLNAATKQDILQAEADVASRQLNLLYAKESVENYNDALLKILGDKGEKDLEAPYAVASLAEISTTEEPIDFRSWIKNVRSFDIDTMIKEIELKKINLSYQIAKNDLLPSLDFVVSGETIGTEKSPSDAFNGTYDRSGYNMSAGLRFSVPLGSRKEKAIMRQANLNVIKTQTEIDSIVQTMLFNARTAWRIFFSAKNRITAAKSALNLQRETYNGQRKMHSLGSSTITDVLSAQDALDSAELELIQATLDYIVSASKLERLDGRILSKNGFSWENEY